MAQIKESAGSQPVEIPSFPNDDRVLKVVRSIQTHGWDRDGDNSECKGPRI